MKQRLIWRKITGFGAFLCFFVLAFSIYLQTSVGLVPCPLCVLQRAVFLLLGLFYLVACLHQPKIKGKFVYLIILLFTNLLGAVIAGRQIYLQHSADGQSLSCIPNLPYMLKNLPLSDTFHNLIRGGADCAQIHWTLFTLSLADWALIGFSFLILLKIWKLLLLARRGPTNQMPS